MIALGLARIAQDERGPEGGGGLGGADVRDAAQEALAVAPAPHARQERAGDVLEGEVEVGHARMEDGVDQLVGQARGIEVEQPGAVDALGHGAGERGHGRATGGDPPAWHRTVAPVGREVLGHQHDLAEGRRAR